MKIISKKEIVIFVKDKVMIQINLFYCIFEFLQLPSNCHRFYGVLYIIGVFFRFSKYDWTPAREQSKLFAAKFEAAVHHHLRKRIAAVTAATPPNPITRKSNRVTKNPQKHLFQTLWQQQPSRWAADDGGRTGQYIFGKQQQKDCGGWGWPWRWSDSNLTVKSDVKTPTSFRPNARK